MCSIPILYYHSIADHPEASRWSFLSLEIDFFRSQISYLKKKGYYSCTWEELYAHLQGKVKLPRKTVFFHFDDGFLDNWSVVYPIMKEAGFKYSVLVTPEFIEDSNVVRPLISKTTEKNRKDWWGYLSKEEIKLMAKSGLVDIQAHGYTHTWYPASTELIDIYTGKEFYPHLHWNLYPELKPFWLNQFSKMKVPTGYPVFKYEKSLGLDKRFLVNNQFIKNCIDLYDPDVSKKISLEKIKELKDECILKQNLGRFETKKESSSRLLKELKGTKDYISKITGSPTEHLVFPGGGSTGKVNKLAYDNGYKLTSKGTDFNFFASGNKKVSRLSSAYILPGNLINKIMNLPILRFQLRRGKGNLLFEKIAAIIK